jgi:hypothetical protein
MKNALLDALMRLFLNGPPLTDGDAVMRLVIAALMQWKAARARCAEKSGAGFLRNRNSQVLGGAPSQLKGWAAFATAIRHEEDGNDVQITLGDSVELPDVVRQTDEDRELKEKAEEESERLALSQVGPYQPEQGWKVDEIPADIPFPGVPELCKDTEKFLKQRHIAFKCLDGWKMGKMHAKQETSVQKGSKGFFGIKVKNVAGWLLYDLKKETYRKDWVLLSLC